MSRNRRRFSPHGRKFLERGVERSHKVFDKGLVTDKIETPNGALEELDNARAFGSEVRGAPGTLLHNRADYQLTPDYNETYADALMPNGTIYEAKGSAPITGDVFLSLSYTDFKNLPLREAKRLYFNCRKVDSSRTTQIHYKYSSNIIIVGSGKAIDTPTQVKASYLDDSSTDVTSILSGVATNTRVALSEIADPDNYKQFTITGVTDDVIDSQYEYDTSDIQGSGSFTVGMDVNLTILGSGYYYEEDYPTPQGYELYEIDTTLDTPIYKGRLSIPHYENYSSQMFNGAFYNFRLSKSGNKITRNDFTFPIPFTSKIVGMYLLYGETFNPSTGYNGRRDLITNVIDSDTLEVSRADFIPDGDYQECLIQPRIHSSIYMPSVNKVYYHAGDKFYEGSVPIMEWNELHGIVERQPFDSSSVMSEIKGDVVVTNDNGHFRIKVNKGDEPSHFWKINSVRPNKAVNKIKYFFGFETSQSSDGENPYAPRGFSGSTNSGESDKTGGAIL
ncbi:MAG: hypothetical protein CMI54_07850 [Parcubacteria group bacterium]|jgi:hypothetical protein|nr:hypothetical protein [Parcubacteria group bacterium]|tara:strand:+ start:2093 stop:3604 length:1512 start_codon:yes stop_codon:yes gene_type:complete